ncbi:MAG: hypothetical protein LC117_10585 [Bacteroidia bacterium]|nr:hypothetical protein [Bacteroidia bacterium]MCZ2278362.1 hypothetical protein [Bacteroidia bacterium]
MKHSPINNECSQYMNCCLLQNASWQFHTGRILLIRIILSGIGFTDFVSQSVTETRTGFTLAD